MIPGRSWISAWLWLALAVLATGCAKPLPLPAEGLRPLPLLLDNEPPLRTAFYDRLRDARLKVDSLQPRLQWEAFPRPVDLKADKDGSLGSARTVTYELRIWQAVGEYGGTCHGWSWIPCIPTELAYARRGLAEPVHTVEVPLAPDTLYLWTVRARFHLNGRPRVTQWAVLTHSDRDPQLPAPRDVAIPSLGYYRFKTPQATPPPPP